MPRVEVSQGTGMSDPLRRARWTLALPQRGTSVVLPAVGSVALLMAALVGALPLREAGSATHASAVALSHPPSYLLGAPLFSVLDAMTVMTPRQHYALIVTVVIGMALGIAWVRARFVACNVRRFWIGVRATAMAIAKVVAIYAAGALLWRPMAALRVSDRDCVVIDFHSHTAASHDGRAGFDAERNREWHRAGGFHVAYVTDHRSFAGVSAAALRNPRYSGDKTVLLGGLEVVVDGRHLNLVGLTPRDSVFYPNGEYDRARHQARLTASDGPLALQTIPGALARLAHGVPLAAIELTDAAPRGISFGLRRRLDVLRISDSLNLAVVAGSDNHGWGRTVAAWSVMHLPGWRRLSPDSLDAAIRNTIRERGRHAVRVVERSTLVGTQGSALLAAITVPRLLWTVATTLTPAERASCLAWLWGLYLWRWLRMNRRPLRVHTRDGLQAPVVSRSRAPRAAKRTAP